MCYANNSICIAGIVLYSAEVRLRQLVEAQDGVTLASRIPCHPEFLSCLNLAMVLTTQFYYFGSGQTLQLERSRF